MFSANENIQLRQYKKRIVEHVEACIPEDVLDLGVNVMVMQVTCKAPGCVPLETAIITVFPPSKTPLMPGLEESAGGSYKAKILKPMAQVTQQDVLEALPPSFIGGLRSPEKLALAARDVMLAQITQLFGDDDLEGRKMMALYLQQSLQDYIDRDCTPPEWGQPFPDREVIPPLLGKEEDASTTTTTTSLVGNGGRSKELEQQAKPTIISGSGNLVIRRPRDDDYLGISAATTSVPSYSSGGAAASATAARPSSSRSGGSTGDSSSSSSLVNSVSRRRMQHQAALQLNSAAATSNTTLNRLVEREHAPGIRKPGCPCCDPDNPRNVVDKMMRL